MKEEYIEEHITCFLEDIYNDDLERLKAIYYGLDSILLSMMYERETDEDFKQYNELLKAKEIIKKVVNKQNDML